jgi:hypothetical protein
MRSALPGSASRVRCPELGAARASDARTLLGSVRFEMSVDELNSHGPFADGGGAPFS